MCGMPPVRKKGKEVAQNYQNLRNFFSRESRLIGEGIGIGLTVAPVGGGIGALGFVSKGMSAKTVLGVGRTFFTGATINSVTQLTFNGGKIGKVDLADALSSGLTSLATKSYGTNIILDAGISSTIDITIDGEVKTVFDGTKSGTDALVDFGIGILGNYTESIFNVNSNESRAFLKSLNPTLKKIIVESVKALESGGTATGGNEIKENLNEKTDL